MVTLLGQLTFPDGATASAQIKAATPDADYRIIWAGCAVNRLPERFSEASVAFLRNWLPAVAAEMGAHCELKEEGDFERWAEDK